MELILDLHGCDLTDISRRKLENFFDEICRLTEMKRRGRPLWWTEKRRIPHLHGLSAIQFVTTSNIVCHLLPLLGAAYINVFSCKAFEPRGVARFAKRYWKARAIANQRLIVRK